jgi:hypothetical protein
MQVLNLKIAGLFTNPNQFSEIPDGALSVADNIQIDKGSVAEPRRGQYRYGQMPSSYTGTIDTLFEYDGRLFASYDNKIAYDNGSGTFTAFTNPYSAQSGYKIKTTQANRNLYFTTTSNIKKISDVGTEPINAGVPRGIDGTGSINTATTTGFLPNGHTVAYRFVWGYKDTNDNLILGSPSGRLTINNNVGNDRNVNLVVYIPDGIDEDYFLQVYRSAATTSASIEPSDELQLVYEHIVTSTDLGAGSISVLDITPENLRGAALYINPTQEGILQANDVPPCAVDITTYKNITFYANTKGKQNFFLTLISATGTSPGLSLGQTITINGLTYTAGSALNVSTRTFALSSTGSASARIVETARSLIQVINRDTSATVTAYYISGYGELPGRIYIEANDFSVSQFYLTSTNITCWNPVLQSSGTANASTNDVYPNRIYYSKIQQPEAVPLLNYLDAGSRDSAIQRIIPLRDSIFVIKEDGVYRIIGEDPSSLRISLFDNTVKLLATESAVECNNQIFCYSDQGIVGISDNGVQVLSRPIEDLIYQSEILSNFETLSFGISYEVDRKYLFYCKTIETDTYPTQGYIYNFFTNAWTRYVHNRSCGIVYQGKLFMGGVDGYIYQERKQLNSSDYVDDEYNVTINSINGNVLTLASATNIQANQIIKQGVNNGVVVSKNVNDVTITDTVGTFTAGSAVAYNAIQSVFEWAQNSGQNPGILKHWREATLLFREADFQSIEMGISSNFDPNVEYTTISPLRTDQWGSFPWGSIPWGIGSGIAYPIRTYVPLIKRRASWVFFRIRNTKPQSYFAIEGISIQFENMSERFK